MKKVFTLLLVLCFGFSLVLTSCAPKAVPAADNPAASTEQSAPAKTYKIATVVKLTGIGWFDRMNEGIQKFAKDTGNETFMVGPQKADAALQVQLIEDLIAQKVDAICIVPFSPEAVEPVLKKAMEAGIVVISHEADNLKNCDYDIEAFDNYAYGAMLMDNLAKAMGEEGEYATTVGSLTSKSQNQWEEGGVARQKEKYPNMKLVAEKIETYDDQQKAYEKMKEMLKAHPNLKGFQGATSQDAPGAALAVEEMGLGGKVKVVGTSMPSIAGKFLESGTISTIGFWDPADAGYAMNKLAVMVLDGKKAEIKDGMNLGVKGYDMLILKNEKYFYGAAWVSCTKENMADYPF
jgi:simple sugar transport system substrate-binding protein